VGSWTDRVTQGTVGRLRGIIRDKVREPLAGIDAIVSKIL
jgi:hypothetical protein